MENQGIDVSNDPKMHVTFTGNIYGKTLKDDLYIIAHQEINNLVSKLKEDRPSIADMRNNYLDYSTTRIFDRFYNALIESSQVKITIQD